MIKKTLIAFIILFTFTIQSFAQHNHKHIAFEAGIGNTVVIFPNNKELAYGLHLHAIKPLKHSPIGIGAGFEKIFDDHGHNTFSIIGTYTIIDHLIVSLAPGLTFESEHKDEFHFTMHSELTYAFEFNKIHLGPMIGAAYRKGHSHFSLGVHLGIGF